jgi:hypothetical protein
MAFDQKKHPAPLASALLHRQQKALSTIEGAFENFAKFPQPGM